MSSNLERMKAAAGKPAPKPAPEPPATVAYQCGHRVGVRHLACQACPSCRNAARAAKAKQRAAKPSPGAGRLPDGAAFLVVYDAAAQRWAGALTLADGTLFTGEASGVFSLLKNLDAAYRAHAEGGA